MGPFRHTVDDGLDNRKVAFECMCTLLSTCAEYLDIELFIIHLENGLNDHYDVKMIVYLMMCKLVKLRPKDTLKSNFFQIDTKGLELNNWYSQGRVILL